jgi:IS5 family transposase
VTVFRASTFSARSKPIIAQHVTPPRRLGLGPNLSTKKARKRKFLEEMDRLVQWNALE